MMPTYGGVPPFMPGFDPMMNPFMGMGRPMGVVDPIAAWYLAHYGQQPAMGGAALGGAAFGAAPFAGYNMPQVPDAQHRTAPTDVCRFHVFGTLPLPALHSGSSYARYDVVGGASETGILWPRHPGCAQLLTCGLSVRHLTSLELRHSVLSPGHNRTVNGSLEVISG